MTPLGWHGIKADFSHCQMVGHRILLSFVLPLGDKSAENLFVSVFLLVKLFTTCEYNAYRERKIVQKISKGVS